MSELSDSLCTTKTVMLGGTEYQISKITMSIWAAFENQAELNKGIKGYKELTVEERMSLPIEFLQTTTGRLSLLASCINKCRKVDDYITPTQLGDSLTFADMVDMINIVTDLMNESQPVKLPGEDDGPGNPEETAGV